MAAKRYHYLHLTIKQLSLVDQEALATKLNGAKDWMRYAPSSYFIWTKRSAREWSELLRPLIVARGATYIIFAADMSERQGYISKDVWAWLKKHDADNPYPDALKALEELAALKPKKIPSGE